MVARVLLYTYCQGNTPSIYCLGPRAGPESWQLAFARVLS